MIQYLKNNEIDFKKYDACIEAAINTRIYAYSWYLNCVADNWDILVLNDYEAVMPLPWRQKYFIKYIYPPDWTQQLGVFSNDDTPETLILDFIKAIPKKFKKVTIQFNGVNIVKHKNVTERVNYILPLNLPYETLFKAFRKDRKYRLNQGKSKNLIVKNTTINELILVGKTDYSYLKINNKSYQRLKNLSKQLLENDNGFLLGVYDEKNHFLGGSMFLKDTTRITYLYSVATEKGKENQITSLVIAHVIKKFSSSCYVLDFEGSMIKGIASFYKSFGGKSEEYFSFQNSILLF